MISILVPSKSIDTFFDIPSLITESLFNGISAHANESKSNDDFFMFDINCYASFLFSRFRMLINSKSTLVTLTLTLRGLNQRIRSSARLCSSNSFTKPLRSVNTRTIFTSSDQNATSATRTLYFNTHYTGCRLLTKVKITNSLYENCKIERLKVSK